MANGVTSPDGSSRGSPILMITYSLKQRQPSLKSNYLAHESQFTSKHPDIYNVRSGRSPGNKTALTLQLINEETRNDKDVLAERDSQLENQAILT